MVTAAHNPEAEQEEQDYPELLQLRDDLDLYQGANRPDGTPTWVLHDKVRMRFFSVGWMEYEALRRWPKKDPRIIAESIHNETTLSTTPEEILSFAKFLNDNELLRAENPAVRNMIYARGKQKKDFFQIIIHNYLFVRVPLLRPDRFLQATQWMSTPFFSKFFWIAVSLVGFTGLLLVIRQWSEFMQYFKQVQNFEGVVFLIIGLCFSKIIHEFGHAFACKRFGLTVPTMGIVFMVMAPFLYTDTSESWKLRERRKRIIIGIAGVMAEYSLACTATFLWAVIPDSDVRTACFFLATVSWFSTLMINLSPFLRWDGYYVFSDILGVENLQQRAFAVTKWWLRELLFDLKEPIPEKFEPQMQRTLIIYSILTWIYRLILFLGIALLVYYLFFKVLGIFLFIVEMWVFIFKPIWNELYAWWSRRSKMRFNLHSIITLTLFASIIAVLLIPWRSTVNAPGVAAARLNETMYAPESAQVIEVAAEQGAQVEQGDLLFRLDKIDLTLQQRISESDILSNRRLLAQSGTQELLETRAVNQSALRKAVTSYRGYSSRLDRLNIQAPFDGEIVMLNGKVHKGRWVNEKIPLAIVADTSSTEVVAYVAEDDIARIQIGSTAKFYSENPLVKPVPGKVTFIDQVNITSLPDELLAKTYGGEIEVTPDQKEKQIKPIKAYYRARIQISENDKHRIKLLQRGKVHIDADKISLVGRAWRHAFAVIIREAKF